MRGCLRGRGEMLTGGSRVDRSAMRGGKEQRPKQRQQREFHREEPRQVAPQRAPPRRATRRRHPTRRRPVRHERTSLLALQLNRGRSAGERRGTGASGRRVTDTLLGWVPLAGTATTV